MPSSVTHLMCAALCCNKKPRNADNDLSELRDLPRQVPSHSPLAQGRRTEPGTPTEMNSRTVPGHSTHPPPRPRQAIDVKATPVTNSTKIDHGMSAKHLHETPGNYPWTAPNQTPTATCCDHYHPITMARTQNLNNAMALRQHMLEAVRQGRTVTSPGNETQGYGKNGLRGDEMEISVAPNPKVAKPGNAMARGGTSKGG